MNKKPDWFLATAIEAVDDNGVGQDVVLYLPGMVIAGRIISEPRFFRRLSEFDRAGFDWSEIAQKRSDFEKAWKARADEIINLADSEDRKLTREEQEEFDSLQRQRIHLENVMIVGVVRLPIQTELWRGDLHDVMGWVFGNLPSDIA